MKKTARLFDFCALLVCVVWISMPIWIRGGWAWWPQMLFAYGAVVTFLLLVAALGVVLTSDMKWIEKAVWSIVSFPLALGSGWAGVMMVLARFGVIDIG